MGVVSAAMRVFVSMSLASGLTSLSASCATSTASGQTEQATTPPFPPYAAPLAPQPRSRPPRHVPTLIRGGAVMTAAGAIHAPGYVVLVDGRVAEVGPGEGVLPPGGVAFEARGKFITPGLIDTHSHIGVYPLPQASAHADGNEATSPTTAEVQAEHSFWPQDPSIPRALAGGVTAIQILPGSANLIGGRTSVLKLRPDATSARELRLVLAPQGLKMACGENPKRVYGDEKHMFPSTRMGNVAGYRKAFQAAVEYRRRWQKYERDLALWRNRQGHPSPSSSPSTSTTIEAGKPDDPPEPPGRDLGLETLVGVLDGKILVQNHCYRADEMHIMLDLAQEFGFSIRSFHHAVEAYKLRDRLSAEGVSVSTWVDWWGFKLEAWDGIRENVALLSDAGVRAVLHSDSESEIRHLNQEAGKAQAAGRRIGLDITDDDALRWITANPAWVLGIEGETGTLEAGRAADVVIWDRHPFSVYAHAEIVFSDGDVVFDRRSPPRSDFDLGLTPPPTAKTPADLRPRAGLDVRPGAGGADGANGSSGVAR